LLQTLQESTATTDNKANAQEYDEGIDSVFTAAALKKQPHRRHSRQFQRRVILQGPKPIQETTLLHHLIQPELVGCTIKIDPSRSAERTDNRS